MKFCLNFILFLCLACQSDNNLILKRDQIIIVDLYDKNSSEAFRIDYKVKLKSNVKNFQATWYIKDIASDSIIFHSKSKRFTHIEADRPPIGQAIYKTVILFVQVSYETVKSELIQVSKYRTLVGSKQDKLNRL